MSHEEVPALLKAWSEGRREAADELFPLIYEELRRMARLQRVRRYGQTLSTTAVVHETYLKLVGANRVQAEDREHFFALAARAMRQILVDHARRQGAAKRGGEAGPAEDVEMVAVAERSVEVLALNEALSKLEELEERLGRVVELRFFGGLSVEETADVLELSPRTVKRDWRRARAFLWRELSGAAWL